jgi:hypothetical protein
VLTPADPLSELRNEIRCSQRQSRFSERPAHWVLRQLRKRPEVGGRLLDLRDFPMPFFDQPLPPVQGSAEPEQQANAMIDDLLWWTEVLKSARERS